MLKKILMLGIVAILLFSLSACGYPIDKFDSLEEMQAVLPKEMYYFDFEQEGIKEAGNFEATKTSKDGGYFRYSIWYDVEYEIGGQKQERKIRIVANDETRPGSLSYKSTEAYRTIVNPIYSSWLGTLDTIKIVGFNWGAITFDENKKVLIFYIVGYYYFYDFVLEGVQASFIEQELESFLSICKFAIENKYQIT